MRIKSLSLALAGTDLTQSRGLIEREAADVLGTPEKTINRRCKARLVANGADVSQHSRAVTVAYVLVAFTLVCATAVLAVTSAASGAPPRPVRATLISNHSSPAAMNEHFDEHPWRTLPASSLGLPDGTCHAYGNKVSWIVLQCFRAQVALGPQPHPRPVRALPPISNRSSPAAMDKHFDQHPWRRFPASSLGLPDGTCYAYGNKVSWIVLQCFGAQPEVKP